LKIPRDNDKIWIWIAALPFSGPFSPKGGEKMRSYETMYILSPDLSEEERKGLIERFKNLIIENGGEITNFDEWGKRKLAYPIDKKPEGYYVLMNFNSDSRVSRELERVYKITDGVLRYLIIRTDE
jgi:small subunit ribosomal protein S6